MFAPKKLVIATRASRLALWQADYVRSLLVDMYPNCSIDILTIVTKGDRILDRTLSKVGGKGLFVKEIENALIDGSADLAVHSMKDVPAEIHSDLDICAITKREDPRDAFVSNIFLSLDTLPDGSVVGTSSLRRESQIKHLFPNLIVKSLRGNLDTRLEKLDRGDYDAIILAAAGLIRIGLENRIRQLVDYNIVLPAVAQGALGIQIRKDRNDLRSILKPLSCSFTETCVSAERVVLRLLGGSCQVPIAAHSRVVDNKLLLSALVGSVDGKNIIKCEDSSDLRNSVSLGENIAQRLLANGADKILRDLPIL